MKDLFLCHTGADNAWVEHLAARLEAERIGGRPISVWFDKWDVDYGENILAKIEDGLRQSRYLGVVLSPALTRAEWPRLEWQSRIWDDPTGKHGRILPLLLHKADPETSEPIDIPLPLRPLRRFDFTEPRRFESEFQDLVRRLRGEPPGRGENRGIPAATPAIEGQEAPDASDEIIVGNLFPVRAFPDRIWSDLTSVRDPMVVWATTRGKRSPPFLLADGRFYLFPAPQNPDVPYRGFLSGVDPRQEHTADWLESAEGSRRVVRLFNSALREHAFSLGVRTSPRDRGQFYCATLDRRPRTFRWSSRGSRVRTLAKMAVRPSGEEFGVHYAARMRFIVLSHGVYLLVEPGWLFTSDGVTPLEGRQVTVLSTKWGGKERNRSVLRNLLMWTAILRNRGPVIDIALGAGETLKVDPVPVYARMSVGIEGDQQKLDYLLSEEPAVEELTDRELVGREEIDEIARLEIAGAFERPIGGGHGQEGSEEDEEPLLPF